MSTRYAEARPDLEPLCNLGRSRLSLTNVGRLKLGFLPEEEICLVEIEMVRAYDQGFIAVWPQEGSGGGVCAWN
jgi:hypothetical protein